MPSISVFTLNCWGIGMGVSRDRVVRMRAIAEHLAAAQYDIVCLQEIWCPEDYATICHVARDQLPHTHFFDHGIIGSGTCVLSRAPILDAAFHEFSMNGYPHKVLHGDWFAGKGIGVCTIDFQGLSINVFVSHFHAEYNRGDDIYAGHRVMQALEAAQWIKLTAAGADLSIYAGDFNTEPCDAPYWLLRTVAGLQDCWLEVHPGHTAEDAAGHTCNTAYNTYREAGPGKRIDYIMYRPGRGRAAVTTQHCQLPLNRRIPASLAARLGREVSYSDHEAVTSLIRVEEGEAAAAWSQVCGSLGRRRGAAITEALEVVARAGRGTARDQRLYSVLAVLVMLAFAATFAQLLATSSVMLECGMFLLRLLFSLTAVYAVCMATLFNRRERHALSATKSTLLLLKSQCDSYGSTS